MKLYLDVDGVLLGHSSVGDSSTALAAHAADFLEFALDRFDVHWLTTNCDGTRASVVNYLRPYADDHVVQLVEQVFPTKFVTLKTEVLFGDFFWLDDAPLATEKRILQSRGCLDRWIDVNTRRRPADLVRAMGVLRSRL